MFDMASGLNVAKSKISTNIENVSGNNLSSSSGRLLITVIHIIILNTEEPKNV